MGFGLGARPVPPRIEVRRTSTWGGRILQLALTALVTYFILRRLGVGWAEVRALDASWWKPHPGWLLLSSATLFGGYAFSSVLWARLVRDFGAPLIPARRAIALFMTANLGRYIPGKVWQILGLAYLSRTEGVGSVAAGTAAILGQLFALMAAGVIGAAALRTGGVLHPSVPWIAGVAGIIGILVLGVPALRTAAFGLLQRVSGTELDSSKVGLGFGLRWSALYILNWIMYALAFWLFVKSYQPDVSFVSAGPAFAAAYLVGYLFLPAPAGLGVREGALTVLLAPVLGATAAFAVAATSRLWATVVELVPAAVMASPVLARARNFEASSGRES